MQVERGLLRRRRRGGSAGIFAMAALRGDDRAQCLRGECWTWRLLGFSLRLGAEKAELFQQRLAAVLGRGLRRGLGAVGADLRLHRHGEVFNARHWLRANNRLLRRRRNILLRRRQFGLRYHSFRRMVGGWPNLHRADFDLVHQCRRRSRLARRTRRSTRSAQRPPCV